MRFIKYLLLMIFISILCFSIYSLYKIQNEENQNEVLKQELIQEIKIPDIPSKKPDFIVDFDKLKSINKDVVGWIVMEGTQINYPVVQSSNNSYYLNHSYEKKYSSFGSIFLDYSSSTNFSDRNSFIYGHHTRNGSMFGELYKYMTETFLKEHPTYMLYTPSRNYIAEIFSAYIDNTTSESYNQKFNSIEEYKKYIDMIKEKSNYKTEVDVNAKEDKIITLYSCSHESNRQKTDRYYIHAVLRSV